MIIDLSYMLTEKTAIYPGNPAFFVERVQDIKKGYGSNVSRIVIGSHTGTHIDMPSHFFDDGETIDQISLDRMCGRAKVIDVTGNDEIDFELIKDIEIVQDDILIFKTDNSLKWMCDCILDDYVTFTYEAAQYLASKPIKLIGIDYLSIERPRKKRLYGESIHKILLGSGILICEAIDLANIGAGEYDFFCIPMNIKGLDGCPARVLISC